MITCPLELKRYLAEPRFGIDFVPLIDLCLVGLFFALPGSRFITSPGVTLDIPTVSAEVLNAIPTSAVVSVLTIRDNEIVLFDGSIVRPDAVESVLNDYAAQREGRHLVLLIKIDKNVRVQSLLEICDFARQAGFDIVQIAAEEKKAHSEFLSSRGPTD